MVNHEIVKFLSPVVKNDACSWILCASVVKFLKTFSCVDRKEKEEVWSGENGCYGA